MKFPQSFHGNSFQARKLEGEVSTDGNSLSRRNLPLPEECFQRGAYETSTVENGNFSGVSKTVSKGLSNCPTCGAIVNIRWRRCLACNKPLSDAPGNSYTGRNMELPKATRAPHSETAANTSRAMHSAWTGETAEHAEWFLSAEPPTEPFQLKPGVTVARPALYWKHMQNDVLVGPSGPRAYYGAIQDDLACLYERFNDVERDAIQQLDGDQRPAPSPSANCRRSGCQSHESEKGQTMTISGNESEKLGEQLTNSDVVEDDLSVDQWLKIRKEAALRIDPQTAEVEWTYAFTLDPYGVDPDLPEECKLAGREYFACSPDSDIWVWFGDLPNEVKEELWNMHRSKLAFPAGLFD